MTLSSQTLSCGPLCGRQMPSLIKRKNYYSRNSSTSVCFLLISWNSHSNIFFEKKSGDFEQLEVNTVKPCCSVTLKNCSMLLAAGLQLHQSHHTETATQRANDHNSFTKSNYHSQSFSTSSPHITLLPLLFPCLRFHPFFCVVMWFDTGKRVRKKKKQQQLDLAGSGYWGRTIRSIMRTVTHRIYILLPHGIQVVKIGKLAVFFFFQQCIIIVILLRPQ